jgi:hypothetical protein
VAAAAPQRHHRYWLASFESNNALADLCNPTGDFVAHGERRLRVAPFLFGATSHRTQIRVTKSAASDFNQKLARAGRRFGHVLKLRWFLGLDQAICNHVFLSVKLSDI